MIYMQMFRGIELNNYAIHVPVIQLLYSAILSFLQAKSIPPVLKWTLTDSTLNYSRPNLYSGGGRVVRILLGKFGIQLLKFTTSILEKNWPHDPLLPPPPNPSGKHNYPSDPGNWEKIFCICAWISNPFLNIHCLSVFISV